MCRTVSHHACHFLAKHQNRNAFKVGMSDPALELLTQYGFPGNIRELENIVQRAISFAKGPLVMREEVETYLKSGAASSGPLPGPHLDKETYPALKGHLRKVERDFVLARLHACDWNVSDAAKAMEITRTALHNRMKKLGINSRELRKSGVGADFRDGSNLVKKD